MYRLKILEIVKRVFILSNRQIINAELIEASQIWTDTLFEIVPGERLVASFNRAVRNNKSSFAPNAFDLINAWREVEAEETARRAEIEKERAEKNPVLRCPQKMSHVSSEGKIYINLHGDADVLAPCPFCRTEDFENWKKTEIALYGQPKTVTLPEISKSVYEPAFQNSPYQEEIISDEEARALTTEHNHLLGALYDEQAVADLLVIFDEGGNCFRHPKRFIPQYTAKDMRERIERYKQILAEREKGEEK